MTITLCNGKGGTGKTTLTMLLANALAEAGKSVGVIDRDPQRTSTRWIEQNPSNVSLVTDGQRHDATFIDTPPRLESPAVSQSIRESSITLLVCSPSPADLWTGQDTVAIIRKHLAPKAKALILFNRVQAHTILSRDLTDLAERIGLPMLKATVSHRQCYQHAAVLGWKALTSEAREELLKVAIAALAG